VLLFVWAGLKLQFLGLKPNDRGLKSNV
jgi:hypothetical protein